MPFCFCCFDHALSPQAHLDGVFCRYVTGIVSVFCPWRHAETGLLWWCGLARTRVPLRTQIAAGIRSGRVRESRVSHVQPRLPRPRRSSLLSGQRHDDWGDSVRRIRTNRLLLHLSVCLAVVCLFFVFRLVLCCVTLLLPHPPFPNIRRPSPVHPSSPPPPTATSPLVCTAR